VVSSAYTRNENREAGWLMALNGLLSAVHTLDLACAIVVGRGALAPSCPCPADTESSYGEKEKDNARYL